MNFGLKRLPNRRSYKIIMEVLFNSAFIRQELMKYNKVDIIEVDNGSA